MSASNIMWVGWLRLQEPRSVTHVAIIGDTVNGDYRYTGAIHGWCFIVYHNAAEIDKNDSDKDEAIFS